MRHLANAHSVTCTASSIYRTAFFCRLAGPVVPTSKAIVHWIGCINAIKWIIFGIQMVILITLRI